MNIEHATEQRREDKRKRADVRRRYGEMDKRYGEIGISAVAGALKHHPSEKPRKKDREIVPQDCD